MGLDGGDGLGRVVSWSWGPGVAAHHTLEFPIPLEGRRPGRSLCEQQDEAALGVVPLGASGQPPTREGHPPYPRSDSRVLAGREFSFTGSCGHFSPCCDAGVCVGGRRYAPYFLLNCGPRGTNSRNGNRMLADGVELGCQVAFKNVFFSGGQVHQAGVLSWLVG